MRIVGVNIPDNKKIGIALTYIFGIGRSAAQRIIRETGVDASKRVSEISSDEVGKIRDYLESHFTIEGELKRGVQNNIRRLKAINSYRGMRHAKNLPSRGQKTKTNSRTVRGNVRRTAGSGRKPPASKT